MQIKTETSFLRPIGSFDELTQVTDELSSSLIHRCPQRGEKGARGAGGSAGFETAHDGKNCQFKKHKKSVSHIYILTTQLWIIIWKT